MSAGHRHAWFAWLGLLLLGATELGGSFFHFDRSLRPLLLLPALAMVALVGLTFMRVQTQHRTGARLRARRTAMAVAPPGPWHDGPTDPRGLPCRCAVQHRPVNQAPQTTFSPLP